MKKYYLICFLLPVLVGCGTTLTGNKRPGSSSEGIEKIPGIPITLTKPIFTITEAPLKTGGAEYEVSINWVADNDQRYTINIDPALLTETDFGLTIGSHGHLTTTNSASREQITPTIKTIGQFVATAVGVATKLGAAILDEDDSKPGKDLKARLKEIKDSCDIKSEKCLIWETMELPIIGEKPITNKECKETKQFQKRHWRTPTKKEVKALGELINGVFGNNQQLGKIFPLSKINHQWLISTQQLLMCNKNKMSAALSIKPDEGLENLKAFLDKELSLVDEENRLAFKHNIDAVIDTVKVGSKDLMEIQVNNLSLSDKKKNKIKKLAELTIKSFFAKENIPKVENELLLISFILNSNEQMTLYKVQEIEHDIALIQAKDAKNSSTKPDKRIKDLREQWLVAINAYEEGLRESELNTFLSSGPRPLRGLSPEAQARAVQDYALSRKQLTEVRSVIEQKRILLNPTKLDTPEKAERKVTVRSVIWNEVGSSNGAWVKNWVQNNVAGSTKPEFVIVREQENF